jgi:hypothetical protein
MWIVADEEMGNERAMEIHVTKKILTIKTSQALKNVGLCLDVALLFLTAKSWAWLFDKKSCSNLKKFSTIFRRF